LEHILPQNPKVDSLWFQNFKSTNINNYINNLGNLTLILGKKNTSLGNKEFTEKRLELKDSNIKQNLKIARNESWTRKEIEERAKDLATKMIYVWPK
ncbi:HNH endonuclease family protein, partial [Staphylococcus gallinarum]